MALDIEFDRLKNDISQTARTISRTSVSSGGVVTSLSLNHEQLLDLQYVANRVIPCKIKLDKVGDRLWVVMIIPNDRGFVLEDDLKIIEEMCWEEK
ncbi:MAG: hypothetical protein K2G70_07025 [Turicibacter sp.]|nr:hypothetical protein [Turicibacter sp.]